MKKRIYAAAMLVTYWGICAILIALMLISNTFGFWKTAALLFAILFSLIVMTYALIKDSA